MRPFFSLHHHHNHNHFSGELRIRYSTERNPIFARAAHDVLFMCFNFFSPAFFKSYGTDTLQVSFPNTNGFHMAPHGNLKKN